jgi:hypothetical protein
LKTIEELLRQVPWINPRTVEAHLAMPEGVRVFFRPRTPVMMIRQEGKLVAMVSIDGVVLPIGFSAADNENLIKVDIPRSVQVDGYGEVVSNPLLQEAWRIFPEVDQLKALTRLNFTSIQQQADFRTNASAIAPPLSFVTSDGLEIEWGRATSTPDPFSVDANNRPLSLERKGRRLSLLMQQFPNLGGVGRVVLDDPLVKVFDRQGKPLELKKTIH